MTLCQAIDRYTNNAEYERRNGSIQGCMEFRQLAEWLKDYKRLLEQEPKTGHWINKEFRKEEYVLMGRCSVCGRVRVIDEYCPNCGAKMRREKENG